MKKCFLHLSLLLLMGLSFTRCSFTPIVKSKDIMYDPVSKLQLDVYAPKKIAEPKSVLVFIHGGNWNSGRKSTYKFLGNRMARKGVVTVIIDYRLSPSAEYRGMAMDAAKALRWVGQNIHSHGGDENRIFVAGHSAGGHLAALIAVDQLYFDSLGVRNPVRGAILIDAFGLDMYKYLSNAHYEKNPTYLAMFSKNPKTWKTGSPRYHLHDSMPPFLLYVGGKTYPYIRESTAEFLAAIKTFQPDAKMITQKNKKHIPMITQFLNTHNKIYDEIIGFMKK